MDAKPTVERPFQGWGSVRSRLETLGPDRVLRYLVSYTYGAGSDAGPEYSDQVIHYQNLPAVALCCVRLWEDGAGDLGLNEELSEQQVEELVTIMGELSGVRARTLREQRMREIQAESGIVRASTAMWFTVLQARYRANRAANDLARTWVLFRQGWERHRYKALERLDEGLRDPLASAFDSLEIDLFLRFALYSKKGWVADPEAWFAGTVIAEGLDRVLHFNAFEASSLPNWAELCVELESSLRDRFLERPVVRVRGVLVAPEPVGLFTGIPEQILRRVRETANEELGDVGEAMRTLIGWAFEDYVNELLGELARWSSEQHVGEFKYKNGAGENVPSLDGHLRDDDAVVLFEAKAGVVPEPPDSVVMLQGLLDEFDKLAGKRRRSNGTIRPPVEQAGAFEREWLADRKEIVDALGANRESLYVIVGQVPVPPCVHWVHFRTQIWRPRLPTPGLRLLDERLLFVSIHDLEVLTGFMALKFRQGQATTVYQVLSDWRAHVQTWLAPMTDRGEMIPSLKTFLLRQEPDVPKRPEALSEAWDACMGAISSHGFK